MKKRTFDLFDQNSDEELEGLGSLQITKMRRKLKPKTTKKKIPPLRTLSNVKQFNFSKKKNTMLSSSFRYKKNQNQNQSLLPRKLNENKNFPNLPIDFSSDLRLYLTKRDRKNHDQRQDKINKVFQTNDEEFFTETELQKILDRMKKEWEENISLNYGGIIEEKVLERAKIYNDFNNTCVNRSLSVRDENSYYL
ncbi:akirin-related [Anaeramoeba flamelloides]|uniref:Akirin-related n=1 Tax=Anaeramoeba flamelloides TaxID=1746091 RepID=A0ABQ8Y5U8_9EUKA|nr:akirin-related [Anaeramoeba flamelloides]